MIRTLETGEQRVFHHPEVQLEEYVCNLKDFSSNIKLKYLSTVSLFFLLIMHE